MKHLIDYVIMLVCLAEVSDLKLVKIFLILESIRRISMDLYTCLSSMIPHFSPMIILNSLDRRVNQDNPNASTSS